MTEPTKGPWLIRYYLGQPRTYTLTTDLDDHSKDIANIQGLRGGEEDLATAQLLAAAPEREELVKELEEALRQALGVIATERRDTDRLRWYPGGTAENRWSEGTQEDFRKWWDKTRALAKADGKETKNEHAK